MRKRYWVLAGAVLFFLVIASQRRRSDPAPLPMAAVDNLLTNASLQNAADGLPSGWVLDPKLAARGHVSVAQLPSGATALKLAPNQGNSRKDEPFGIAQMIPAKAVSGRRLMVRSSMRTEGGAAAFTLVFALAGGKPVGSAILTQTDSSPDFVPQEQPLDVPPQADQILFSCVTNTTQGTAWFAGLYLGGGRDAETRGSTGALSVSAVIDATHVVRTIPQELFGTNIEWVRDGNGVWDPKRDAPRPEMVRRARELGVTMVRYPGGGFADYYHWQQGVGSARPSVRYVLDSGESPVRFGTNELLRFCNEIGAVPMLSANVITGTAAEAADWVTYSKRAAAPGGVKYWEIGNEQYIRNTQPNETHAPQDAYLPAADYIQRFRRYAAEMKKADPAVLVGAVSGLNFGRYSFMNDDNWNRELLQQAGSQIDFLAVHNSYAPLVATGESPASFEDTYRAMLAFPTEVEHNFGELDRQIAQYAPASAGHIAIAVTEWGPLFAFLPNNPWVDHCKTLGSALYVADMLEVFLRTPRVQIANFFKFTDDSFMGWLTANGEPKPSYYAMQLFTRHFGTKVVAASVDSPGYNSKAVGTVAAAAGVPYLDVVASLNSDGSQLYVIAVNRSLDQPANTHLQLRGFRPAPLATAWVLAAAALDANNGKDVVGNGWAPQVVPTTNSWFYRGAPGTVVTKQQAVGGAAADFSYTFAPASVTALQFSRSGRPAMP